MQIRKAAGFTLIEIMVVLIVISIGASFALLAFGDFGQSRRVLFAAEQLENIIQLAQEQALLTSSTLGLRIDNKSYQILKLSQNKWMSPSPNALFKMHYFPSNMLVTIRSALKSPANTPSILIYGSGDMTPFTLNFATDKEAITTLEGKQNGTMFFRK